MGDEYSRKFAGVSLQGLAAQVVSHMLIMCFRGLVLCDTGENR